MQTTLSPFENVKEDARQWLHAVVDFLYGTPARTRRTLFVLLGSLIAVKVFEAMVIVPYCPV